MAQVPSQSPYMPHMQLVQEVHNCDLRAQRDSAFFGVAHDATNKHAEKMDRQKGHIKENRIALNQMTHDLVANDASCKQIVGDNDTDIK